MRPLLLTSLLLAAGCASVRTARIDYQRHEVTTCGSRDAAPADLYAEAVRTCTQGAQPLQCEEEIRGYTQALGAGTPLVPIRGTCCTYRCQ